MYDYPEYTITTRKRRKRSRELRRVQQFQFSPFTNVCLFFAGWATSAVVGALGAKLVLDAFSPGAWDNLVGIAMGAF